MPSSNAASPDAISTQPAGEKAGLRQWLGLAMLALPTLLLATDITVLYLALPHLSSDLGPTSTQTLWIIDIYGFLIAGFLVTMGTLGDRIGRRKLLMIGATGFGSAALLAAYAPNTELLIAARALMGVFGATLMPSTLALISNMFRDAKQRTLAIGVWASSFSAGIALGPLMGGVLLEHFWWGSVFLIDVPIIAMLLVTAPLLLPEHRGAAVGRLDLASVSLSLGTVMPIIYGIKELAKDGVDVLPTAAIVFGVAAGVAFARRQRRLADPLIDLTLFRGRAFDAALGILLLGTLSIGGIYLFVTQYLQMIEGLSPIESGLWLLPPALALVASSTLTPIVARRVRPAYVVGGGLMVSAAGYVVLTQVGSSSGLGTLVFGFLLVYAGFSPAFVLGTDLVVASAPPDKQGSAAAVSETSTELGVALGIATLGSLGIAAYRNQMDGAIPEGTSPEASAASRDSLAGAVTAADELPAAAAIELLQPAHEAFTNGLNTVAGLGAVIVAGLAIAGMVLLRHVRPSGDPETETAEAGGLATVLPGDSATTDRAVGAAAAPLEGAVTPAGDRATVQGGVGQEPVIGRG